MLNVDTADRAELECAILRYEIMPASTATDLARIAALSDEELREIAQAWILAGDECAQA